jgi:hypothetical protein
MSNYTITSVKTGTLKFIAIIPCLFLFTNLLLAQANTSYNVNSIPINGIANNAFGLYALSSNTPGSQNIAIGNKALESNLTGTFNTTSGYQALAEIPPATTILPMEGLHLFLIPLALPILLME